MFAWDIPFWWCCLNPREREVLRATIEALALTFWVGIPVEIWDGFWLIHSSNGQAVRDAFLSIYKLEIVTIVVDPELPPVDVVRARFALDYGSWLLFLAEPEAACLAGCEQSTVP